MPIIACNMISVVGLFNNILRIFTTVYNQTKIWKGYTFSIRKHRSKVPTKAKKRRCINIISHVESNLSNDLKLSNIYSFGIRTNCTYSKIEYGSSSNSLFSPLLIIYTESSVCSNEEMSVEDDTNDDNTNAMSSLELI